MTLTQPQPFASANAVDNDGVLVQMSKALHDLSEPDLWPNGNHRRAVYRVALGAIQVTDAMDREALRRARLRTAVFQRGEFCR
jgi:hypothetical protein